MKAAAQEHPVGKMRCSSFLLLLSLSLTTALPAPQEERILIEVDESALERFESEPEEKIKTDLEKLLQVHENKNTTFKEFQPSMFYKVIALVC